MRNYNGLKNREISPSREIFFDGGTIRQYRPINKLLI
jgi:hypothetical protein